MEFNSFGPAVGRLGSDSSRGAQVEAGGAEPPLTLTTGLDCFAILRPLFAAPGGKCPTDLCHLAALIVCKLPVLIARHSALQATHVLYTSLCFVLFKKSFYFVVIV